MVDIRLLQKTGLPSTAGIDRVPCWMMVFAADYATGRAFSAQPYAAQLLQRWRQLGGKRDCDSVCTLDLPNARASQAAFSLLPGQAPDTFTLLCLARNLCEAHRKLRPERLGILVQGFSAAESERLAEGLISAVLAAHAELPSYRGKAAPGSRLRTIELYGARAGHRFADSFAIAEGNALARSLSCLPGNKLTPGSYLRRLRVLAREQGWGLTFYNEAALRRKKAGAFLAVTQGSPRADAGIARLRYLPRARRRGAPRVALVGKGICYDTGGVNLKPASYMFGMHEDMQGSAVALGALLALSRTGFRHPVDCWLALASNHIGPRAYKPNDVVHAANGASIEIVHTDAEGRMILADTLSLACAARPALIIDYATLTGSCIHAIGKAYSGVFSNREAWRETLLAAGAASGERVWPFPLSEDYDEDLKSTIADVKQCAARGEADHILAARFLQRFVKPEIPWLHIDLSSSNRRGGLAHIPSDTTGFGVRYSVHLLARLPQLLRAAAGRGG